MRDLLFVSICLLLMPLPLHALTAEEVIRLKGAGVDEKTIRMMIEREAPPRQAPEESQGGLGVREIERPGGGKDKVYYSITPREEEAEREREEREKLDRSWEILRNVIIDRRN